MRFTSVMAAIVLGLFWIGVARSADEKKATVAHIRLTGDLDETPVAEDSLFGGGGENFAVKLQRFDKARKDKDVHALLLHIEGLSVGWGKLDELRRAVVDFRKSGKKVYAYLEDGSSKDYLLATACDEIILPESGWLMLVGMRSEVSFYADTLEMIGVKADMLQMGDFKGAAEPLMRNKMSKELREQMTLVLDDVFEKSYVDPIVKGRSGKDWNAQQVKKLIDRGPYTAKSALNAGLIDRVAYPQQVEEILKTTLKADQLKVVHRYGQAEEKGLDLANPLDLLKLFAPAKTTTSKNPKIAVIYAVGEIVSGKGGVSLLGGGSVGSTTMVEAIRQAEEDKTVKAIVLRVDSPGGSALASDLIWNELTRCKKPVIASMGDTAASGGYYISMACRKIYAEPGTITGSIGVVGGKLVVKGLFDKVGIKTEVIAHGANSGILSIESAFSDSERKAMTNLMQDVYDQFLNKAVQGREKAGKKMTRTDLEKYAGGRIWTGRQAKEHGLVDELGTLGDAITSAKQMADVKDAEMELLILPKPRSFLDMFLDRNADTRAPELNAALLPLLEKMPELKDHLRGVDNLLRLKSEPVWTMLPYRVHTR